MHERRDDRLRSGELIEREETLCPFDSFEFLSETNTYEARYDVADVPASIAVIGAMAVVRDRAPERLDPLGGRIDIEALDGLLAARSRGTSEQMAVSFVYHECEVTVTGRGTVTVRDPPIDEHTVEGRERVGQLSD